MTNLPVEKMFGRLTAVDIGCGAGILSESLGRLGFQRVQGIDPTPKCIELAEAHLDQLKDEELAARVKYNNTTMEQFLEDHPETKFDLVCCSEVIEHVHNQEKFLQDCIRLAKPNTGLLFVSSIAKTPEGYLSNIVFGEYILGLLPKGTHEWDLLINPETVEKYLGVGNPEHKVPPFETLEKTGVFIRNPMTMEMMELPAFTRSNYMLMSRPTVTSL